jgi:Holliday junction resolvase
MAATPESKVKAKIKAILKEHGVYYAMPIGTGYGNAGVPDFLCCVDGIFLAIEAKANGGMPTALQEKNLRDIEAAGGVTCVLNEDNVSALGGYLKLMTEKK